MPLAYIALGSNLGDRIQQMRAALDLLEEAQAVRVLRVSTVYQNRAIGMGDAEDFYNAVAAVETALEPEALLELCLQTETRLGRVRSDTWAPRTIDLDLLLYGTRVLDSERLVLPHPRIAERDFVAVPLCELDPELFVSKKPIRDIVDSLSCIELEKVRDLIR